MRTRTLAKPDRARRAAALALPIAVGLLALGAAPALAAPSWSSPVDLIPFAANAYQVNPQVTVDPQGDAVAVWEDQATDAIDAATRPASTGLWGDPVQISPAGQDASSPQVGIDGAGNAVVAWIDESDSETVEALTGSAVTGTWQDTPTTLSGSETGARNLQLAVNAAGDAVVAWYGGAGGVVTVVGTEGGSWGTPAVVYADDAYYTYPRVAIDAAGDAVAVWYAASVVNDTTGINTIEASTQAAGADTWATPVQLSANGVDAYAPDVAVDAAGDAVAGWDVNIPGSDDTNEYAAQTAAGEAATNVWNAPATLAPVDTTTNSYADVEYVQVAVNAAGDAAAAWETTGTSNQDVIEQAVDGSVTSEGVAWQTVNDVSPDGDDAANNTLAIDPQGDALLAWNDVGADEVPTSVYAAFSPAGTDSWQAPVTLSAAGATDELPQVALDGSGNAVAVWEDGTVEDDGGPLLFGTAIDNATQDGTVIQASSYTASPVTPTPTPTPTPAVVSTTTTTTAPTPTSTPAPAPSSPLLACTSAAVVLTDVVEQGSHVLLRGAARAPLIGHTVRIVLLATHATVAHVVVAANGSFSATAPLPAASIRDTNLARYEAISGHAVSLALKLTRRMYMTSVTRSGADVLIAGYVTGAFKPGTSVAIGLRVTCRSYKIVATVKLTQSGRFAARVAAPTGTSGQIAVYRASTKVLDGSAPFSTYTLPTPIG